LERAGASRSGYLKHVDRTIHVGLDGMYGICLVVGRRGRAGQIVDLLDVRLEGDGYVMLDQPEAWMIQEILYVGHGTRGEVVEAGDVIAHPKQVQAEVRAKKTSSACHCDTFRHRTLLDLLLPGDWKPNRRYRRAVPACP